MKNRASSSFTPEFCGRQAPMYSALAGALLADIQSGRYSVGDQLPTEEALQQQFDVSRHTVRQALRVLKEQGFISAHAGIGTKVRAKQTSFRFIHNATTIDDLVQFSKLTRMKVIGRRELIADKHYADLLQCNPGQAWLEITVLRYVPKESVPFGYLLTYLRPEFAGIVSQIDSSRHPVFSMIEKQYGVRFAEMEQEIASVSLTTEIAKKLKAPRNGHGLQITRRYLDNQHRLAQVTIGIYAAERFVHTTKMRVHRGGGADA